MVEYGCNVDNKFGFMSDDDEFDDPQELISHVTQLVAEKAAAQKKAEKLAKQAAALPKEPVKCAAEAPPLPPATPLIRASSSRQEGEGEPIREAGSRRGAEHEGAVEEVCDPPQLNQRSVKPSLHDLPEQIVEPLIGICLDSMRLGAQELSLSPKTLKAHPTPYWTALGETDEERRTQLEERRKAMRRWRRLIKGALQRALRDIRKYVLDSNGRLVPAPKMKLVHGCHTRRSSRRYIDDDDEDYDNA